MVCGSWRSHRATPRITPPASWGKNRCRVTCPERHSGEWAEPHQHAGGQVLGPRPTCLPAQGNPLQVGCQALRRSGLPAGSTRLLCGPST